MSDGRLPARRRWVRWAIGLVVTLVLLAIGWVVIRGAGAISELQNVERSASQLRSSFAKGDLNRIEKIAPRIPQHAALARDLTSDPIWRGFEFIPWLGPNFTAMREIAEITDSVAGDAAESVLDTTGDINLATLGLAGSKIDLSPFADIEESLAAADRSLSEADSQAQQIDADTTLAPMADAVQQVRKAITEYATVVGALHGASVLLPSMLGGDEPRNYVIAMQNNAAVRSDGGSIDALTLVRAEGGVVSIKGQASAQDFPALAEPLPLNESTVMLFGDRPGRFMQNASSIPDFSEAGRAIATRWEQKFGGTVDGVVLVDAIVAEHLIEITGPVSFGPFTADSDTVVPILLSTLYAEVESAQRSAVFAKSAKALLTAALQSGDPQKILGALADAADENRVRIWSAHPEEEEFLAATSLGGDLPQDDERATYVGVLFNDLTGGRMNFYTEASVTTAIGSCSGQPTTQVRVTWTNNAPADAADNLPASVTGNADEDKEPGDVRTLIAVYGPEGATVTNPESASGEDLVQTAKLGTRSAIQHDVTLAPGESTTITVSFIGEGAGDRLTRVQHTPMIEELQAIRGDLICD